MTEEISTREAAKYSGYSQDHIYRLLDAGRVKGRKVVTVWLVDKGSLDDYIERMEKDPRGGPRSKN